MTLGDDQIKRTYSKLSAPFWGLLVSSIVVISGLVFISTQGQDRNAIRASVHLANASVQAAKRTLENISLETAYWDQAVNNLVDNFDSEWARENLGAYLNDEYQISSAYVIDKDNQSTFSAINGIIQPDAPMTRFGTELETLIATARLGTSDTAPTPAVGILRTSDGLQLVAVTRLTTYETVAGEEIDRATDSVLILTRVFDSKILGEIAENYLLPNLHLILPDEPIGLASIPLKTPTGAVIGHLKWKPVLPGKTILPRLIAGMLGVLIIMGIAMAVFLRRTKDVSVQLSEQANQLAQKSELLKSTLDSVDQGIASWDLDSRLLTWNQKCEEFWYAPDGVRVGMTKRELLSHIGNKGGLGTGNPIEVAENKYQEILKDGENSWDSFSLNDGRFITLYRYPLPSGGHTTVYTDVTERHTYETRLQFAKELAEESNLTKSKFIANVSHELRTPLNAIIGFSEMMAAKVYGNLGSEKYEEYVAAINEAGRLLLEQIDQILDLSKIEAGKLILEPIELNIKEIAVYSANFLRPQIEAKTQNLEFDIPDNLPPLYADRTALNQIVINLLSNAVKFTPANGTITISAGISDAGHDLTIQDTGRGMNEEILKTVMEPFVQATDAQHHSQKGTGLGLSIVKALVELHGGDFIIRSQVNMGTTATCYFPQKSELSGLRSQQPENN